MQRVNLFWKLAVDALGSLDDLQLPAAARRLEEIAEPHVTLLFFGGRDEKKAAEKARMSLSEFQCMNSALAAREGESIDFTVDAVFVHPEVVFATVSLPSNLPCNNDQPFLKLRASKTASGSIVRSLLEEGVPLTRINFAEPLLLHGRIEMETGEPLPQAQRCRKPRLADESQGDWVHVKKHSSMSCAVVQFPSPEIRDAVLKRCQFQEISGTPFDVKPHHEELHGEKKEVRSALFFAWRAGYGKPINAQSLQSWFDKLTAPRMPSRLPVEADFAQGMLRNETLGVAQSGTSSSGEEVVVIRLTRMARSPQVTNLLLQSPALESCRRRVRDAGCDLMPEWAAGAKVFVPSIQSQEVVEAGVTLQDHHLIVYQSDVHLIQQVIAEMPRRQRPKVSHQQAMGRRRRPQTENEEPAFIVVCTFRTNSSIACSSYGL
eukprot:TRINITY_DN76485_c0_g1_i1.p1 TRINITY_DN76485_c0_g1~~TRINITY_DN76485_c0_g1_i1.p1  ORF type:complete len:433 (-),score=66.99 TRINITY_DN76485_c0_g1_i1:414-1712(-)